MTEFVKKVVRIVLALANKYFFHIHLVIDIHNVNVFLLYYRILLYIQTPIDRLLYNS